MPSSTIDIPKRAASIEKDLRALAAQAANEGQWPVVRAASLAAENLADIGGLAMFPASLGKQKSSVSRKKKNLTTAKLRQDIREQVIEPIIPKEYLSKTTRYFINATGRFEIGGPMADTGLTGRKIIVDTYGGLGRAGGGCFSGKDPTKVDRSASYMARYIAKNIVAAKLADRCEIQLAYCIGVKEPVSVLVDSFRTGKVSDEKLSKAIYELFDLTPGGIIRDLKLRRPYYKQTAAYGHFGRDEEGFTWEEVDKVEALKKAVK